MFSIITDPIAQLLQFFTQTTGDLGWAIILLTISIRLALVPLTLPGQKKQNETRLKMQKIKPQLDKLKEKYKDDKVKLSQAQMDLYKEHDINLFSIGSLLPLVQIVFLIALYHVLLDQLGALEIHPIFFGLDLVEKDSTFILPVLAAGLQLILSIMILPGLEKHDVVPEKSTKKSLKKLNEKETDQQEMMESIQQQMVFIFPVITGVFAAQFPAGVALYWVATTLFSIVQQYFVSGLGGLEKYLKYLPIPALKK